mgnify:FL=1|tara:strand:+ start:71 stop:550 length:480 start_codon:yes stop_codon:yes gene_type:complete
MKYILIIFYFLITFQAYNFEYTRTISGKRTIITSFDITGEEKFVNFVLDGTFTDNLGNYGYSKSNTTVLLNKSDVMRLEGFGKYTFQNKEVFYTRGVRNKQEQNSGVGENEIIGATGSLKELIGMKCTYAIKFLEDYYFWIQKCEITENQKKLLSNLSK